jgi:glycosyltransferase involved in cell wall biosynthesis
MKQTISVVIPCHNEENAIEVVLRKIAAIRLNLPQITEVLVVDDGSTDRSSALLAATPDVRVLRNEKAQGYGAALKKGFLAAQGDLILFMDMDDTYDIQDLPKMLWLMNDRNLSVVFGNRLTEQNRMPFIRRFGNNLYHYCLKLFLLPKIADPCTGMRLFRRELREEFCHLSENDLSYSMALTVHILKTKIPFDETRILYHERIGESKLNSFQDGLRFFWSILANR